jgi:hypothetical protein
MEPILLVKEGWKIPPKMVCASNVTGVLSVEDTMLRTLWAS